MSTKTPIALLQELCMQRQQGPPMFDEIIDEVHGAVQTFACKVSAFGQTAVGKGKAKKDAKHLSAFMLLNQLKTLKEFENDLKFIPQPPTTAIPMDVDKPVTTDPVTTLLDLCIRREFPIALFQLMKAQGESHSPVFTIECRVASIARNGTASSKKQAKHLAAEAVLAVIESISDTPQNLQNIVDPETIENRIKTYRELKKMGMKDEYNGTKLSDRHKFFEKISAPKLNEIKNILENIDETPKEKISLILRTLKLKYEYVNFNDSKNTKILEIRGDFDCCIAYPEEVLYGNVLKYLMEMMNIPVVGIYC